MSKSILLAVSVAALSMSAQADNVNIHDNTLTVSNQDITGFTIGAKVTGLGGGDCFAAFVTGAITGTGRCINPGGYAPKPKRFTQSVDVAAYGVAPGNGNIDPLSVDVDVTAEDTCPNPNWTSVVLSYEGLLNYEVCNIGPAVGGVCATPISCDGVSDKLVDSAGPIEVSSGVTP